MPHCSLNVGWTVSFFKRIEKGEYSKFTVEESGTHHLNQGIRVNISSDDVWICIYQTFPDMT